MIIKHPDPQHKSGLSALWQEAFQEPEESFLLFYDTAFSSHRAMVCLEENTVVAALYWFDCLWNGKKVAYLYAVATKKTHRGKGLCNKLMTKTHQHLKERGYFGAILVPAEAPLFSFYSKMGYLPCCPGAIPAKKAPTDEGAVSEADWGRDHSQFSILNSQLNLTPITLEEYLSLQKDLLPQDAVLHTDAAYAYLSHFGEFYKTETGILCKTEEEVQEILPYSPSGKNTAMYLPLTEDKTLPFYFAHPLA